MDQKRLDQLLHQRALIQEHLIWLDAEIDALQAKGSSFPSAIPPNRLEELDTAAETSAKPKLLPEPAPAPDPDPNPAHAITDIYDELGPNTEDSVQDTRKGCFLIFGAACLALAALVAWIWFAY